MWPGVVVGWYEDFKEDIGPGGVISCCGSNAVCFSFDWFGILDVTKISILPSRSTTMGYQVHGDGAHAHSGAMNTIVAGLRSVDHR